MLKSGCKYLDAWHWQKDPRGDELSRPPEFGGQLMATGCNHKSRPDVSSSILGLQQSIAEDANPSGISLCAPIWIWQPVMVRWIEVMLACSSNTSMRWIGCSAI
jgi:hypothetical protein